MLAAGLRRSRAAALRQLSTSSCLNAVPAKVTEPGTSISWLSKVLGEAPTLGTPLSEPLPGFEPPEPRKPPAERPQTVQTELPSGLKVAAEETWGPTTTIGLYVDCGSVRERPDQTGMTHLLEYLAFKSTKHRTHFRLVREVEALGASVVASGSREQMVYSMDVVRDNVAEALEVLVDSVLNPALWPWEVKEQLVRLEADVKTVKENHHTLLLEGLHNVAYRGPLGQPLLAQENRIAHLTRDAVAQFLGENYHPSRMVLAGSGVSNSELASLAEPMFSSYHKVPAAAPPPSQYVGGDFRQYLAEPMTHLILGFQFTGGWRNVKGSVAATVLQYLLGGGGSFSAGGPGKGMHSRLYTRVLNRHNWVHSCAAFSNMYNDTGILGIYAAGESHKAEALSQIITDELLAVAKNVPSEELERAKRTTVNHVLMNLESRSIVAEDIGRQVLTYGRRIPTNEFISAIMELTPADMSKAVQQLLKTPLSLAALGNISEVPRYDTMAKRFG